MRQRFTSLGLGVLIGFSSLFTTPLAIAAPGDASANGIETPPAAGQTTGENQPTDTKTAKVRVIVTLQAQPAIPSANTEAANKNSQAQLLQQWQEKYDLQPDRQFGYLFNGFSAEIPEDKIAELLAEPAVASVKRERIYYPTENYARDLQGVSEAIKNSGADGTGIVVSIVDSGIDPAHRDLTLDNCDAAAIKTINSNPTNAANGFTCKVPNGYNYADENYDIKDTSVDQHGQHVAGIVAANGKASDGNGTHVQGAAPNAQLLAMKVFSNTGGSGAQDSDIIAAIEDSVKLGADVINMSLGSPNGITDNSDGAYRAIAKAREAGVLVVVAAGNDGKNFDLGGGLADVQGYHDDGTIASPAVQGAFSVASVENSHIGQQSASYNDGTDHSFAFAPATGEFTDQAYEIIDAGIGKPEEFKAEAKGKFALIKRGELTFADKFKNAADAGVAGVLVWNNEEGGEQFVGMGGVESYTFPSASIKHSTGKAIQDAIKKAADGTPVTVKFAGTWVFENSALSLQPSGFTSWGTTPSLDFTPDIAGIGGNVFSLQNDNKYGTKSGTSMATPNIAGISALLLQKYKELYPDLSKPELINRVQISLSNTADILDKNGVPYSPRQIGAGLAQADEALANSVFATVDGKASVSLREITGAREITVDLENAGKTDAVYTIPAQQVIRESNGVENSTNTSVSNEKVSADKQSVTVPAGGKAQVKFSITPDVSKEGFILGWLKLKADNTQQDLNIPYLGFVGDWNKEKIVAAPGTGLPAKLIPAGLTTPVTGLTTTDGLVSGKALGDTKQIGWISPNDDLKSDDVTPDMVLLRNAFDARYSIRQDETLIAELGQVSDLHRLSGLRISAATAPGQLKSTGAKFNGKVYLPEKAEFAPVPDGIYTYRIETRLSEEFDWQITDMNFGVDTKAPEVTIEKQTNGDLKVSAADCADPGKQCAGVAKVSAVNEEGKAVKATDNGDGTYTVKAADFAKASAVFVNASDNAGNTGTAAKSLIDKLTLFDADQYNKPGFVFGNAVSQKFQDGILTLDGLYPDEVVKISVNGKELTADEMADGQFATKVELQPGAVKIKVTGYNTAGDETDTVEITSTYDNIAPTMQITEIELDQDGAAVPVMESAFGIGKVHVAGTVTDNRKDAKLSVRGLLNEIPVGTDGSFSGDFVVMPGLVNTLSLTASDGANLSAATEYPIAVTGASAPVVAPGKVSAVWNNVQCLAGYQMCLISGTDNKDVKAGADGAKTFTLRGKASRSDLRIEFTPEAEVNPAGDNFAPADPISATIQQDGSFTAELPLQVGENHFSYVLKQADGKVVVEAPASFWFDVNLPTLRFSEPTLIGGTLYTNKDEVLFKGTASDDGWGYTLSINNFVPADEFYNSGIGAPSNQRDFERLVAVKDGDKILLNITDAMGNAALSLIPVVADKLNPEITINETFTIDGEERASVADRGWIAEGDSADFSATATDKNLASLTIAVDDRVVATENTKLKTESVKGPEKVEDTFVDVNDLTGGAVTDTAVSAAGERAPEATASADEGSVAETDANTGADNVAGEDPVVAEGTLTGNEETTLTVSASVADLKPGIHTYSATGYDLAGNTHTETRTFFVYADTKVSVEGDQPFSFEIDRSELNLDGVSKYLLPHVKVTPGSVIDPDTGTVSPEDVTAKPAADQLLREGENDVKIIFVNADGTEVANPITVKVTLKLKQNTLEAAGVTAVSTFRNDDSLSVEWSESGANKAVKISNRADFNTAILAPENAVITIPAEQDSSLWQVGENGELLAVNAEYRDGGFVFTGAYDAVYMLVPPAKAVPPRPAFELDLAGNYSAGFGAENPAVLLTRTGASLGIILLLGVFAGGLGAFMCRKSRSAQKLTDTPEV